MKRTLCALLALICLACPAWAEVTLESVSPTPSAAPAGVAFSGDGISLTLPSGLEPLSQEALEGYAAAVEHDFPGAAQISLAAADEARGAFVALLRTESELSATEAAREAAERILGGSESVAEVQYGENACAALACAIEARTYTLYLLSDGAQLLVLAVSGLEEKEVSGILTGLQF